MYLHSYILLLLCNLQKDITVQCKLVLNYSLYQGRHLYIYEMIDTASYNGVNKRIIM